MILSNQPLLFFFKTTAISLFGKAKKTTMLNGHLLRKNTNYDNYDSPIMRK